ncbi:hypothetical protein BK739_12555 [Bacillus thuringiensis serovar pirenaica]|uniref:hypothetical protein n=1 Tax=Bacillus thuringiensis TaxID=1428 RepID=UPI000A3A5F1B|nr:hypothetical protein [Bacillus thuringiensis]OUB28461.1 hypothetical protein BK739_12555 [Bacillus thuringiensis serovar pirenaica]
MRARYFENFIHYTFYDEKDKSDFEGNATITINKKMDRNMILVIANDIAKRNNVKGDEVIIRNYQLLREKRGRKI